MNYTVNGFIANTGEVFSWLSEDYDSAQKFSEWYNEVSVALGVFKPRITPEDVMQNAKNMSEYCADFLCFIHAE